MKKLLVLLIIFPTLLLCQTQVSNIDYDLPRDDYIKKGFIKFEEQEYFIEQGIEGTKVSKIDSGELIFLHTIRHRPTDSTINPYVYSFDNSTSGMIHNGSVMYELYSDYIYEIDFLSGELINITNLKDLDIRLNTDFHFGDNYYYFSAFIDYTRKYVRVDRNSNELTIFEGNGKLVNTKRYFRSEDGQAVDVYDLETKEVKRLPHQFENINYINNSLFDSTTYLIIRDTSNIYQLKADGSLERLDCQVQDSDDFLYLSDSRLGIRDTSGFTLINLNDCSTIFSFNAEIVSDIRIFTSKDLFDNFFIYGTRNDWQGDGEYFLYNIRENTSYPLDIRIDFPVLAMSVRYDNYLYFIANNHLHHIGFLPELYRLNLNNGAVSRISNHDIFTTRDIIIGEQQSDKELNIFYRLDTTSFITTSNITSNQLETIKEFNLYQNHGIYYGIVADIWAANKYFFSASSSIYCTTDDSTFKVLDLSPDAIGTSKFLRKDNFIYTFGELDSALYVIKLDINTLSYSKTKIPWIGYYSHDITTTSNAIVSLRSSGYFDIILEEFIEFESLGIPNGKVASISGDNILYQTYSTHGGNWLLINTRTRELTSTEIEPLTFPKPYANGEGSFYLEGWKGSDQVDFNYLDYEGKVTTIYKDFDYYLFAGGNKFSGKTKSLAYYGNDEIIIITVNDDVVKQKRIPAIGYSYLSNFFWYESDQISFIEVRNDTSFDTYVFSFNEEPKKIFPDSRSERLISVLEEDEFSILIFKDDKHVLSFEKYDYTTGEISKINEIQSVKFNPIGRSIKKVSDSQYLLSINDGIHGQEPWLINTENGNCLLIEDIWTGFVSSDVDHISLDSNSSTVYFTATKTSGDRQLYKLNSNLLATKTNELKEDFNNILSIYPNPTVDYLNIIGDFQEVFILDINGKQVLHENNVRNSSIELPTLPNGIYMIYALSDSNLWKSNKFTIIK